MDFNEFYQPRLAIRSIIIIAPSEDLDGSIKKHTSFIKKLKSGVNSSTLPSMLQDLSHLKVEKYLDEIATTLVEVIYKSTGEVLACVELIVCINGRFEGFVEMVRVDLMRIITGSTKATSEGDGREEQTRLGRLKSCLRVLVELHIAGLLKDGVKPKEFVVPMALTLIFAKDSKMVNMNLAVSFLKSYAVFYLVEDEGNIYCSLPLREEVNRIFKAYFSVVKDSLVSDHLRLQKLDKSNQDSMIARGELTSERQEQYSNLMKSYDRMKTNAVILAGFLKLEMPLLAVDEEKRMSITVGERKEEEESSLGGWEDEGEKAFYESIIDLRNRVPASLLGLDTAAATVAEGQAEEEEEGSWEADADREEKEEMEEKEVGTTRQLFASLIAKLSQSCTVAVVDQVAIEFMFINNRGTRRQLISHLMSVSRGRLDLIPFYCRFIKTINPFVPEVGLGIVEELESLFRRKKVAKEERVRNIKYMSELTKFKIIGSHVIFHILKVFLETNKIELACFLLESCGRFLHFNVETNQTLISFLDILNRKKLVMNLDQNYVNMIENAIYCCNPPDVVRAIPKPKLPIVIFISNLIYKTLTQETAINTANLIRKLNWKDPFIFKFLLKLFSKVWKVKYSSIPQLAQIVAEISIYHPEFASHVIDSCLEEIRTGLELNIFLQNQRRLCLVKYLGELFNFKLLHSSTIFDTLYLLLRFGHPNGIPQSSSNPPLDSSYDFFRLRLVSTLIETSYQLFKKGPLALKLDNYLVFLQMYIFTKNPMPIDAHFFVMEMIDLVRPKMVLIATYDECVTLVNKVFGTSSKVEEEEEDVISNMAEGGREISNSSVGEDESTVEITKLEKEKEKEVEDGDFEREFARLLQESVESRRSDKKSVIFDAPIPARRSIPTQPENPNEIAFTLLTKRGNNKSNKQLTLNLPVDSSFAILSVEKREKEQEERVILKKLVLDYEKREREGVEGLPIVKNKQGQTRARAAWGSK